MVGGLVSGEQKVLDLVGTIYDAALDAKLWPDVLKSIGDAVGGPQIVFGIYDPANSVVNMHAPRTDPDIMRSLVDWAQTKPALPCVASYPPGRVFSGADIIRPDEFTRTAFYHGWWRPAGFSTDPLVTNLFAGGAASGHFASHSLPNRSPLDFEKRLFALLAQHLVRAVALQRNLHHLTIANASTPAELNELKQGFLLVDAAARLLFVNPAARALFGPDDGLRIEGGVLSASNASDRRTLRGLIASCVTDDNLESSFGGTTALRRKAGRLPLNVLVTPIQPDTAMVAIPWTFPQRAAAIVLISDPDAEIKARVNDLRERFGFTSAEAAFTLEIIKGDGRQAAADRLGITVGTARSHLSKIFDKSGARNQTELVLLLRDQVNRR
jgi:DNA-binding CsgD family transcriptional regulator